MTLKQLSLLFKVAALFNLTVAITLVFFTDLFFELLNLGELPVQPIFLHLFAGIVLTFALLYYQISISPQGKRQLVQFSILAKFAVVIVCLIDSASGLVAWTINIPAFGDLIFAVLFIKVLATKHTD